MVNLKKIEDLYVGVIYVDAWYYRTRASDTDLGGWQFSLIRSVTRTKTKPNATPIDHDSSSWSQMGLKLSSSIVHCYGTVQNWWHNSAASKENDLFCSVFEFDLPVPIVTGIERRRHSVKCCIVAYSMLW